MNSDLRSVRDRPAYSVSEGARYVRLAPATLRSWVVGRIYPKREGVARFEPLIRAADSAANVLSFHNLVEAHVLRALRTEHGVSIKHLRAAIAYAEHELGIERLLLNQELGTDGGRLLLDRYGRLIDLTASGQLAMRRVFDDHIRRVVWNARIPIRLYPFMSTTAGDRQPVAIDPEIAFGRPVVARRSISTRIIAERNDAGESVPDVANDYDLTDSEVEEAVLYERAA